MSIRGPAPIPSGMPADDRDEWMLPAGIPLDDAGNPLIPELANRTPTHNESFLINGGVVTAASTNVKEFWWNWDARRLFVRFLDGSLYVYEGVPLSVAVGFIETASPGRYVWNTLRDVYPYMRLERGEQHHTHPQVVRLINR